MSLIWFARLSMLIAAFFLPAAALNAALPTSEEVPKHSSLAGQLLVAAPELADPRFFHAVILVVRHDRDGAFGIIINRPVGNRPLANLLEALATRTRTPESKEASASSRVVPSSQNWASCYTALTIIAMRP